MLAVLLLSAIVLFVAAYRFYGAWIARKLRVDDAHAVPSEYMYDGTDYVPAKTPVLFGHHFSSIAGAGPIVGPILAGLFFGWLPVVVWIVLGSIFVGGVHDFGSMVASIRHKARSIAELAKDYMTPLSFRLFLAFIWLTMVYIIVVFMDLTAVSFIDARDAAGRETAQGTGVAVAAGTFIVLAILLGVVNNRTKLPVRASTLIFVPALLLAVGLSSMIHSDGSYIPAVFADPKHMWILILLAYCLMASVTPVWILLQPRDYLSSFLLYFTVLGGGLGILAATLGGGFQVTWPALVDSSHPVFSEVAHLGPLFPILFITVACGACSGFHSIVSSGTTAKQLSRETDARRIGYGGMLVEGVVAIIALGTIMSLSFGAGALRSDPVGLFSAGIGQFFGALGIPVRYGTMLGLLTLSTFLLTTLDTCTRLARFVLQEFLGWDNAVARNRWMATLITLVLPAFMVFMTYTTPTGQAIPVWRAIWPVFGATNQLLAGLALLAVTIWLKRTGRTWQFVGAPMVFMVGMTLSATILLVSSPATATPVRVISGFLLVLGVMMVVEAFRSLRKPDVPPEKIILRSDLGRMAPALSVGAVALALLVGLASCGPARPGAAPHPVAESRTQRAQHGMVSSAHHLASEVGAQVLRDGGNAVDAAVATGLALAVVHPSAGNIGGGGFMVIRFPDGRATALDFREKAPLGAHPEMFLDADGEYSRAVHADSHVAVGVPGTVAGLALAHEKYGTGSWARLVEPAVALARDGYELSPTLAASFERTLPSMEPYPASMAVFAKDGEPYAGGDVWRQPDLARTLERIRDHGREEFYRGETARLLTAEMARGGGILTAEDLARYQAVERAPAHGTYRGYDVISMAPPSSGGTALVQMLNILEGFDLSAMGHNSPAYVHHLAEAMRRAYRDRARHLGDPDFSPVPLERLTSKGYAEVLRGEIDPHRASSSAPTDVSPPEEGFETTQFSVVDAQGMAVSVTYTLQSLYGSKIVVPGAGFLLNNQMSDFNPVPGVTTEAGRIGTEPNLARPEQRMLSSMSPTILARDGQLVAVIGTPGGLTIINIVLQLVLNMVDFGMDPHEAVHAKRVHHQWLPDEIRLEEGALGQDGLEAMEAMGHSVRTVATMGRAHSVMVDPRTGERVGVPDLRKADSGAAGY
jgi:gamma-glutamyltranspeptidase / glutathione hydrolase